MDYRNLITRSSTSIVFFIFISIFFIFLDNYISVLLFLIYLIIFYEVFTNFKKNIIYINLYLLLSLICHFTYFNYLYDKKIFIFTIFLIISFDIFAYICGSLYGVKKITPKISPNKTYFGFYSSYLITIFLSFIINYLFYSLSFYFILFYSTVIIIFSFFGDILQSSFKRSSELKNSSNLIPGHGGFFDRFDSFIMVIIIINPIGILLW